MYSNEELKKIRGMNPRTPIGLFACYALKRACQNAYNFVQVTLKWLSMAVLIGLQENNRFQFCAPLPIRCAPCSLKAGYGPVLCPSTLLPIRDQSIVLLLLVRVVAARQFVRPSVRPRLRAHRQQMPSHRTYKAKQTLRSFSTPIKTSNCCNLIQQQYD